MEIKSRHPNGYQFTIDVNLMHATPTIESISTLKRWKAEGKIELIEAEPPRGYGWSGNGSSTTGRGRKKQPNESFSFRNASALLFPNRDSSRLKMNEVNDVVHLMKHHQSKNEIFVTGNLKEFIENGKRERLLSSYGIVAMTPDEAVQTMAKLQGWK